MSTLINSIPAQQIKQRGITAVDDLLGRGPVHVIMRNEPRYVVMDEAQYGDLLDELREKKHEAFVAGVRESMEQVNAGNVQRFDSVASLMAAIDDADDE
jgi:PHD/YefM family antitoxin component YafN of YafNO toxin-antitoxin module